MTDRRAFITSGLGLAGIIAAGRAPAALVRSAIAARQVAFTKGEHPMIDIYVNSIKFYDGTAGNPMSGEYDLNFIHLIRCTSLAQCFAQMRNLSKVDISSWDMSTVTNVAEMFNSVGVDVPVFEIELPHDVPNVTSYNMAFRMPKARTLDLTGWYFKSAANLAPFYGNVNMVSLRLSEGAFLYGQDFSSCTALSAESAVSICNSCATVSSSQTMKLPLSKRDVYEADESFVSARDTAITRGWSFVFA